MSAFGKLCRARLARPLAWSVLVGLIAWVAISYAEGGIVGLMLRGDLVAADKLELLAEFFEGLGVLAPGGGATLSGAVATDPVMSQRYFRAKAHVPLAP